MFAGAPGVADAFDIVVITCSITNKLMLRFSRGDNMISYDPFWQTLQERGISTYKLIYEHGILPDTIQRLRDGKTITTKTINTLCIVLGCNVSDILQFVPEDENEG